MRVAIVTGLARSLVNFRGHLIAELIAAGHEVVALTSAGSSSEHDQIAALGAEHVPIPFARGIASPLKELHSVRVLRSELVQAGIDATISFTLKASLTGGLASKRAGIAHTAVVTGLGHLFLDQSTAGSIKRRCVLPLLRRGLASSTSVFVQNPDDAAELLALGLCDETRLQLINGSGVDLDHFAFRPMPDGERLRFLFVGRLIREKGIVELLDAVELQASCGSPIQLTIAGDSDRSDPGFAREIRARMSSLGVDYLGRIADIRPAIAGAHVMVLPSYREGTPRSCLEAMAMGRALIVTDVPGCREVVQHSENGLLVAPRSADALAAAMREMESLGQAAVQLYGHNGRALAEHRFDVREVSAALVTAIERSASDPSL